MAFFPAHIRIDEAGRKHVQSCEAHCRAVSEYAADDLRRAGLYHAGKLAGLAHDGGKFQKDFCDYISKAADGEKVKKGSVNHSFFATRFLLEKHQDSPPLGFESLTAEIIAYAAGAHHGLFDCVDENGLDGFERRRAKDGIGFEESRENYLRFCALEPEINELFRKSVDEVAEKLSLLSEISQDASEMSFYGGMLTRLLLSAVIDGDRRDTAEFEFNLKYSDFPENMQKIWEDRRTFFLEKLAEFQSDTPIQQSRRRFSESCEKLSEKQSGIFRLSLPTGAGKTLASLRAALSCAKAQNKKRIIYAIPLLSVLDQNAKIIREYIGDDSLVLEHHSNLVNERPDENGDKRELLSENWSRPVVITTLVQLLNTLFDGRKSCIRRMQALCGSVLVVDEVQSVPIHLLSLFNLAINFLAKACGVTVLLCSATQPCLENAAHPLYRKPEELVPYSPAEWEIFRRTRIRMPRDVRLSEIGSLLQSEQNGSLLVVCNTKREAADVYAQLEGVKRYHLSASMCMAHRRKTLAAIEHALAEKSAFICVSTQLIESGVDISFQKAARIMAGLDNILQTAGRCNRNGENNTPTEIMVLRCVDEKLGGLEDIMAAQNASEALFEEYAKHPEAFLNDLSSDLAISFYYRNLYRLYKKGAQDGPQKGGESLYELLSDNTRAVGKIKTVSNYWLRQAFAAAGNAFTVFEQDTVDVVVPYGSGREIIADLCSERASRDLVFFAESVARAKPYTVSVFQTQRNALLERGGLFEKHGIYMVNEAWYDDELGLVTDEPDFHFMEV